MEAVGDQVQQHAHELLRVELDLADRRIELLLQRDVEAGLLRPSPVIGQVQALLDAGVEVHLEPLAAALARVKQHVLDDAVGATAVLGHLRQVIGQHAGQLVDLRPGTGAEHGLAGLEGLAQLADQLDREIGEIVDEVQWVLDLVRDSRGELAERSKLLRLHQPILRGVQSGKRGLRLLLRLGQRLLAPTNGGDEELQGAGHRANLVSPGRIDGRVPAIGMRKHAVAKTFDPAQHAATHIEERQ